MSETTGYKRKAWCVLYIDSDGVYDSLTLYGDDIYIVVGKIQSDSRLNRYEVLSVERDTAYDI